MAPDLPAKLEDVAVEPRLARDLASARPTDMIAVDRRGDVRSPVAYRVRVGAWYGSILGMVGLLNVVSFTGLGVLGGVVSVPFSLWAGHALWRAKQLSVAAQLAHAGRLDEAERVCVACAANPLLPRVYRGLACSHLTTIARYRGDDAAALAHLRRARQLLRPKMVHRRLLDFGEVILLVNLGDKTAARACLEQRRKGPDGEVYRLAALTAELYVAKAEGRHAFDAEQLHAWGRYALGLTVGAPLCALVGWAFARIGDEDMARHMLAEATDRWEPRYDQMLPALRDLVRGGP